MNFHNAQIHALHIHLPAETVALTAEAIAAPMVTSTPSIPAIGAPWPGVDGVYAGIARGEDGEPDAHLVMLNATPDQRLEHGQAVEWASGLGDGAHLPSKIEGALLYTSLREELLEERWIWLRPQYSASSAWYQYFDDGTQDDSDLEAEGGVRAVRRFPL